MARKTKTTKEKIPQDIPLEVSTEELELAFIEADENSEEAADLKETLATEVDDLDLALESPFEQESSIFLQEEETSESFLPEVAEEEVTGPALLLEGTELDHFEAAEIEDVYFVEEERLESIIESILFASDRPVSLASLKLVFKGTNIKTDKIRKSLDQLAVEYAGGRRGVSLEEVPGGYQLRTKVDNMEFLRRTLKARSFKLSGPALEVLAILAYKQPIVKSEIDEIRGVESGHLLRALMEKGLANFEGKSDLPGRPMLYATTKKFLEIFGLRNLKELPTLSQIDELLPEGIGEEIPVEKATLSQITEAMSEAVVGHYSQGEDELLKIQEQLEDISTSSQFFEDEKKRQVQKRDQEKAQNIREALALGEPVSTRDANWLTRYDQALAAGQNPTVFEATTAEEGTPLAEALEAFDAETDQEQESNDELLFTEEADEIDENEGSPHA